MTDPVDRAALDRLGESADDGSADATAPGTAPTSPAAAFASRARDAGARRAKQAAGKVIDRVGARAAESLHGEIDALRRENERLRAELVALRRDVDAELALVRAELLAARAEPTGADPTG